jgi:hypothetical protein
MKWRKGTEKRGKYEGRRKEKDKGREDRMDKG